MKTSIEDKKYRTSALLAGFSAGILIIMIVVLAIVQKTNL